LKGEGRGSTGGGRSGSIRSLLIVAEVALSLVLLISAGLLLRSLVRLQSIRPGFDPQNVLAVRLSLPKSRYASSEDLAAFYRQLHSRLQSLPGVESVGAINVLPLSGTLATVDFTIVGRPPVAEREEPSANFRTVNAAYFQTMRIPLLAGRSFSEAEDSHAPVVAVINETLARRFWPNGNPVGAHLTIDDVNSGHREIEIAGVVGDVKQTGLDAKPAFDIYVSLYQISPDTVPWLRNNQYWVLRTKTDPLLYAAAARSQVQAVDRDVAAANIMTMDQYIDATVAPRKFNLMLLMIFAGAALLLAAIGIYGVMAYAAGQRTREIGIRMALGAQHIDVLKLIVGQGMRLVLLGLAIGLIGSFALTRVMGGLLFNVSTTDPATFLGISALLAAVALGASWLPAHRASKTDPLVALHYE
jgi:predicted permease